MRGAGPQGAQGAAGPEGAAAPQRGGEARGAGEARGEGEPRGGAEARPEAASPAQPAPLLGGEPKAPARPGPGLFSGRGSAALSLLSGAGPARPLGPRAPGSQGQLGPLGPVGPLGAGRAASGRGEPETKRVPGGGAEGGQGAQGAQPGLAGPTGQGAASAPGGSPRSLEARRLLEEFAALPDDGELLLQKLLSLAGPSPAAELARGLESGVAGAAGSGTAPGEAGVSAASAVPGTAPGPAPEAPQPPSAFAAFGAPLLDDEYIVTEPDSRSVFLVSCPRGATEAELRELFSQAGAVASVRISRGPRGRPPSAVVEYDTREAAERAVPLLHHRLLRGERLTVVPKRTRRRERAEER